MKNILTPVPEVPFTDERATGTVRGWNVMVNCTKDPNTVFVFYINRIDGNTHSERPTPQFINRSLVDNFQVIVDKIATLHNIKKD